MPTARGLPPALAAATLLAAWAAAWWLARGSAAAPVVTGTGISALALTGAAAARARARRSRGTDRRFWTWASVATLCWGVTSAATGWQGWTAGATDGALTSPVVVVLCLATLAVVGVAVVPLLHRCSTGATLARDALDSALLTAAAATAAWYGLLSPSAAAPGAPGPAAAVLLLCELFTAVAVCLVAVRLRGRVPGLGAAAAGASALVLADVLCAALDPLVWWPAQDAIPWSGAVAVAALVAGAGSRGRAVSDDAVRTRRTWTDGALPCAAALLALVSSLPGASSSATEDRVLAWLHVAVLVLLVVRTVLLVRDGDLLTRDLERRVRQRTAALVSEERRFASLVVHSADVVGVVSAEGVITYASPASGRVLGVPSDELVGVRVADLLAHPQTRGLLDAVRAALEAPGSRRRLRVATTQRSGRRLVLDVAVTSLVDDPAVGGVVLNARDVTEAVRLEEELSEQAFSDALTGLANRALFRDRLEHALRGRGGRSSATVLYLDLDGFKAVNDTLGHGAGDELLVAVADRLREVVRDGDTVARLGGDEFAVLLDDSTSAQESERLAQRICDAVRRSFTVRGAQVHVTTSVGVASTRTAGREADHLLQSADLAMYQAKATRQGGFALYDREMHEQLLDRVHLEADLRRAVEQDQFRVVYQPLVDMRTGGVSGVEALVRWHHPERGVVPPVAFIPLAESTGLIDAIGAFVLREACRQVAAWRAEVPGAEQMRLSVNLSGNQLQDPRLVDLVAEVLAESGLPATSLVLEITESVIVDQDETALAALNALRALGVRLAIDDFGTGYSSLSYLHRLPVDVLKIDKSFVDRLAEGGDLSLVDAIISMASTLEMTTVAEGVEHEHQRAALAAQGCTTGQGYHFSPPVDPSELPGLVTGALRAGALGAGPVGVPSEVTR